MEKIDWKRYVDKTYVISYVKNLSKRKIFDAEAARIGLYSYKYKYSINNEIIELSNLKDDGYICDNNLYENGDKTKTKYTTYVTNTHYETIKEAYCLGYERILIFEDDVIFLKDLEKISYELEHSKGFDVFLYDCTEFYVDSNNDYPLFLYQLSSAYSLNRNGMEYMISQIEQSLRVIDSYFTNCTTCVLNNETREIVSCMEYVNNLPFEPKFGKYDKNRICLQYNINDNKVEFDRNIYDKQTFSADPYHKDRIDNGITYEESIEKYNFGQYNE